MILDGCPLTEEENYREEIFRLIPSLKCIDGRDRKGNEVGAESSESDKEDYQENDEELEKQENCFAQTDNELDKEEHEDFYYPKKGLTALNNTYFDNQLEGVDEEGDYSTYNLKTERFESDCLKDFNCSTREDPFEFPFEDDYKVEFDEGNFV